MKIDQDFMFGVAFALLFLIGVLIISRASRNKQSRFNFEDVLLNPDGKTSLSKFGMFIALVVSTWGFVYLTLAYQLTEWYFMTYIITWAGSNSLNKWIEMRHTSLPQSPAKEP